MLFVEKLGHDRYPDQVCATGDSEVQFYLIADDLADNEDYNDYDDGYDADDEDCKCQNDNDAVRTKKKENNC